MNRSLQLYFIILLCGTFGYFASTSFTYSGKTYPTGQVSGKDRSTITNLPWSRFEVSTIADNIGGSAYYEEAANELAFKKEAGKYGIIHIATHAFTDDESPSYSRLLFNNGGGNGEDGILYAYEIYSLRLNSELAVLSSCNTGMGKLIKGEGIFSLARAFMYAGVPSVIMSLWDVDDRSTAEIVVGFYKRLADGESKADALRNVKLDYLRNSDQLTANPVYWAGLVSIGDQSPVKMESRDHSYLFAIVTAVLVFLIYLASKIIISKRSVRVSSPSN